MRVEVRLRTVVTAVIVVTRFNISYNPVLHFAEINGIWGCVIRLFFLNILRSK